MSFDYRDGIAVLKLIVYFPYLLASAYVSYRHGFRKNSGWIFLVVFCIIRIVGSIAELVTISSNSTTPYTIAAVTDAIGLSPLMLSSLGLISRAFYSIIKMPWSILFQMTVLRVPQMLTVVAGILCIVAATSANNIADIEGESTLKIGLILYLVAYFVIIILIMAAAISRRSTGHGERPLIVAVALSLPFLLVRLIYPVIGTFGHASSFNLVTGSVTINLFMVVLEEFIIVCTYTITGIRLDIVPKDIEDAGVAQNMAYRAGRGDFGSDKLGLLSLAFAGLGQLAKSRGAE